MDAGPRRGGGHQRGGSDIGDKRRGTPASDGGDGNGASLAAVLQQALSFRKRHSFCQEGATLAGRQRFRWQD